MTKRLILNEAEIIERYQAGEHATLIARALGISHDVIYRRLASHGVSRRSYHDAHMKHSLNESVFSVVTEESAYWIGFLMADGCVHTRQDTKWATSTLHLYLAERDITHIANFKTFLNSSHNIKSVAKNNAVGLSVASRRLVEDLSRYGVVPRKSKTAQVIGLERDRNFWRGVIDGDGCLSINKRYSTPQMNLVGSLPLLRQFLAFVLSIIPTKASIRPSKGIFSLSLSGQAAIKVMVVLYDNCKTALPRKEEKAKRIIENWRERKG